MSAKKSNFQGSRTTHTRRHSRHLRRSRRTQGQAEPTATPTADNQLVADRLSEIRAIRLLRQ